MHLTGIGTFKEDVSGEHEQSDLPELSDVILVELLNLHILGILLCKPVIIGMMHFLCI